MYNKFFLLLMVLISLSFVSCEEEDDSATMCYILTTTTIRLNCNANKYGSCEDNGRTSLAEYSDWNTCSDDLSDVLAAFQSTGQLSPGPNAIGGGGNNGGGNNGGVDCDLSNYAGPDFDIQVDAYCKAAYAYQCEGNTEAVDANCQLYYEVGGQLISGNLPNCPYCN